MERITFEINAALILHYTPDTSLPFYKNVYQRLTQISGSDNGA
jgi:hypothetical protein